MFAGYPRDRWYRFFSGIVIVSYLTLALLYMLAIPAGESPDEPSHLQCIEQVSLRNRIPVIDPRPQGTVWWARERIISGLVCFHMPLYYLLAGYTQKLVHLISATPIHYEFPPNNPLWETGASVAMFAQTPKDSPSRSARTSHTYDAACRNCPVGSDEHLRCRSCGSPPCPRVARCRAHCHDARRRLAAIPVHEPRDQ